jgi:S-adenosylmethionine:tRNA ribosyltransferase-isomerase
MHEELYHIGEQAVTTINAAKREGRRVVCVGTTSVRSIESAAGALGTSDSALEAAGTVGTGDATRAAGAPAHGAVVGTSDSALAAAGTPTHGTASVRPGWGSTRIFIYPGGRAFQMTDALITNFHLPKSTLLMLVSAFYSREKVLAAYAHAISQRYRFFSYGDAMLIV